MGLDESSDQSDGQQADGSIHRVRRGGSQTEHPTAFPAVAKGPLDHHHQDGADRQGDNHADQHRAQQIKYHNSCKYNENRFAGQAGE